MSAAAPPLRFLAAVLGGWICVRAAMLAPAWWVAGGEAAVAGKDARFAPALPLPDQIPVTALPAGAMPLHRLRSVPRRDPPRPIPAAASVIHPTPGPPFGMARSAIRPPSANVEPAFPQAFTRPDDSGRWSGSAWIFIRRDRAGAALAPGGALGGSQAGARILYRLNDDSARPLALSARVYAPLRRVSGSEAALGLDWRPAAAVPVHLLAERRQRIGEEGRSAFALTLYGGGGRSFRGGLRFDAYAQTGIVGARARNLFVDGSAQLRAPAGPIEIGGAVWGAAQPGAARLDAGPQISYRLPVPGAPLRLSADWRFRLAGDASPGSGPALTLATDF